MKNTYGEIEISEYLKDLLSIKRNKKKITNKKMQFSLESKDKKKKKEEKSRLERLWFLRNLKKRSVAAAANKKESRSVLPEIQATFSK
jgi:hypothetical protein